MPEGDTIAWAANRIRPVLCGRVPDELATSHPRFGLDRWPEKLDGRRVYKHSGRPCPRCGTPIRSRGQGDANRTTYWCTGCQR
jgi:formamidopyrimidine-DNA glycosylase